MKIVSIQFENCYGIGKLEHTFDFSKTNTFLIYAPNGAMKTSFAKTLRYFSNEEDKTPCDQIYPERVPKYDLKIDGNIVSRPENKILIIDPENTNYDASNKIGNFVASKELKESFDKIYNELNTNKSEFIKKLKSVSQSSDCEEEFISTFCQKDNHNFFDALDQISPLLSSKRERFNFRYNDIFDKKGNVRKFLEKHQSNLDIYVKNYESLISKSSFFKKSEVSFGTYQANEILKSIEDGSFFTAGHSLNLNGNIKVDSTDTLKRLIEDEINKIVNDKDLKKIFDKVDKALGSNEELRVFKSAIEKNNLLLLELSNYEDFRKKTWLGYLYEIRDDALTLHSFYSQKKKDLFNLLEKAKKELDIWKDLVNQFNLRFHVPFTVELANQEDVILKQDRAVLNFTYSDRIGQKPVLKEKEDLFGNILSRGEKRAFYILQILFEIESRKMSKEETLVIFDDVADSFDYKNKYAIIEYIKDLDESGRFKIILLTHNFDFYRTVGSRLNLSRTKDVGAIIMMTKKDDGNILFGPGEYINDIFQHFLGKIDQEKIFISMVPFLRNIIEYTEGGKSMEYELLTKCLHKKNGSDSISVSDIVNIWNQRFSKYKSKFQSLSFSSRKIIDLTFNVADQIIAEKTINEILLENKIVLAIAIRLKAEEFMIKNINGVDLDKITSNQTPELLSLYKKEPLATKEKIKTLNKVSLMTPENIHLNAFMYEPLIDMSVLHLVDLYKEVKSL